VAEDEKVFVYHNLENLRMLHGTELQYIQVEPPVSSQFCAGCTHVDSSLMITS